MFENIPWGMKGGYLHTPHIKAEDAMLERLAASLQQLKRDPERWPLAVQETLPAGHQVDDFHVPPFLLENPTVPVSNI